MRLSASSLPVLPLLLLLLGTIHLCTSDIIEWSSDHHLNQTIAIPEGTTLRIGPGVQVSMDPLVLLQIYGTLYIQGTREQPVEILSQGTAIQLFQSSYNNKSRLEHCTFEQLASSDNYSLELKGEGNSSIVELWDISFVRGRGILANQVTLTLVGANMSDLHQAMNISDSSVSIQNSLFSVGGGSSSVSKEPYIIIKNNIELTDHLVRIEGNEFSDIKAQVAISVTDIKGIIFSGNTLQRHGNTGLYIQQEDVSAFYIFNNTFTQVPNPLVLLGSQQQYAASGQVRECAFKNFTTAVNAIALRSITVDNNSFEYGEKIIVAPAPALFTVTNNRAAHVNQFADFTAATTIADGATIRIENNEVSKCTGKLATISAPLIHVRYSNSIHRDTIIISKNSLMDMRDGFRSVILVEFGGQGQSLYLLLEYNTVTSEYDYPTIELNRVEARDQGSNVTLHFNALNTSAPHPVIFQDHETPRVMFVDASYNWWGTSQYNTVLERVGEESFIRFVPFFVTANVEDHSQSNLGYGPEPADSTSTATSESSGFAFVCSTIVILLSIFIF